MPGAARPVLALWFNEVGWRCPYDVRHAVGVKSPLGKLPVRWRFLTLIIQRCFWHGPAQRRGNAGVFRGTPGPAGRATVSGIATSCRRPQVQPPRRSSAEYERLARQILADPRWIAAESLSRRKRERVRARLIDAALAGDPAMPAVMLPTRAQGNPEQFRFHETTRLLRSLMNSNSPSLTIVLRKSQNRVRDLDRRHN